MEPIAACRLAKDVCSALSLLHSRAMVHRDVSARNVRCTSDGLAKLIDFGAMAPIGPNRSGIVGTPSYSAPHYSAPATHYSAPSYSAPAHFSAPSSHSFGGGGHVGGHR